MIGVVRTRVWLAMAAASVVTTAACTSAEPEPRVGGSDAQPSSSPGAPQSPSPDPPPSASPSSAGPSAVPPSLAVDGEVASGLDVPWSIVVLPDGSALVSERETGEIKLLADGGTQVIGVVQDAQAASGEGGLLGMAIGPEFDTDQTLFLYYTSPTDNRVVSVGYSADGLGEPVEVLTGIPKAAIHNGGRIKFGPDGYLYIGTGDASVQANAQNPGSLGGKILRITQDGESAPDNPVDGSPVYSLGHRNVQGLGWDSQNRLWASEFGPEIDDELNLIEPGGNYGWPEVTGAPGADGFIDAQVVWPSTATSSPSGLAVLDDVAYIGGLRGERLWQVPLVDGAAREPVSYFDGEYGRLRDVVEGPDGMLWVATNGDAARILRVRAE